jgi:glutamate/tyrosine decarboxylase-like PLP-dependent enzyme
VATDRRNGLVPLAVVANAGSTNTGAIDPLEALAALCRDEGLWLHVDGAYGAAAVFSARGRRELAGIALADSVTLDPHKWLFQPYPLGCVLLREPQRLRDVFHVLPEYLRDTETSRGEVNFCDYSPELTRPFRAFKLWLTLKVFGAAAFEAAIDHGLTMAERTAELLTEDECWELLTPPSMAIVCFRYRAPRLPAASEDELQTQIARRAAEDGCCFLSTTVLRGRTVLRMCTIQPTTTLEDLSVTLACLRAQGRLETA